MKILHKIQHRIIDPLESRNYLILHLGVILSKLVKKPKFFLIFTWKLSLTSVIPTFCEYTLILFSKIYIQFGSSIFQYKVNYALENNLKYIKHMNFSKVISKKFKKNIDIVTDGKFKFILLHIWSKSKYCILYKNWIYEIKKLKMILNKIHWSKNLPIDLVVSMLKCRYQILHIFLIQDSIKDKKFKIQFYFCISVLNYPHFYLKFVKYYKF